MDPFVGEIKMVGFNFAPRGYAFCNGQLMSIAQNAALFSLLGTFFGGDGVQTFGLPNMQSRVPIHAGTGAGLSNYVLGQLGGTESVTLLQSQMPMHTHQATYNPAAAPSGGAALTIKVPVANAQATQQAPADAIPAQPEVPSRSAPTAVNAYAALSAATGQLGGVALGGTGVVTVAPAGSSLPTPILQPYLCVNFIIALNGVFPSRN